MKNSRTPPTANNHIGQTLKEGPARPTALPDELTIVRVNKSGALGPAGFLTYRKTAVQ